MKNLLTQDQLPNLQAQGTEGENSNPKVGQLSEAVKSIRKEGGDIIKKRLPAIILATLATSPLFLPEQSNAKSNLAQLNSAEIKTTNTVLENKKISLESKYSNESELKSFYEFAEKNKNNNEVKNNISIRINIEEQVLTVYNEENELIKLPIGVARRKNAQEGYRTPKPSELKYDYFIIQHIFTNPIMDLVFYIDSDRNVYSIHTTEDESTIPGKVSQGCIRVKKKHMRALFKIVKVKTKVFID